MNVISNFINGNDLQILILTKQSFDKKEANKLRKKNIDELLGHGSYIEQIGATSPVINIDEPQLNKDFNFGELWELLNPSFVLSYSATHPKENKENIIYSYDSKQAYEDRQVKRLEYCSVQIDGLINALLRLEKKGKINYNRRSYTLKKGESATQRKRFLSEAIERGKVIKTLWDDVETTTNATYFLKEIMGGGYFDKPKASLSCKTYFANFHQAGGFGVGFFCW